MSRFLQQSLVCVALYLVSTMALADLRVLIRFDESGHHVHSLTQAPSRQRLGKLPLDDESSLRSTNLESLSADERVDIARAQLRMSTATLLWFDDTGAWLSTTEEPDPRLTHAPAHIDGVNKSQAGLSDGAWLATGPDSAARVTILFPAFIALALGSEEWHVELTSD